MTNLYDRLGRELAAGVGCAHGLDETGLRNG
jgi:hypothetical protein